MAAALAVGAGVSGGTDAAAEPVTITFHRSTQAGEDAWPPRGSSTLDVAVGDVTSQVVLMPEGGQTVKVGFAARAPLKALHLPEMTVTAGVLAPIGSRDAECRASVRWDISPTVRSGVWASVKADGSREVAASLSVDLPVWPAG